jgi:hypothetical protein
MKGQLPWSVEGLRGQGIELFSRREAFCSSLHSQLIAMVTLHLCAPWIVGRDHISNRAGGKFATKPETLSDLGSTTKMTRCCPMLYPQCR